MKQVGKLLGIVLILGLGALVIYAILHWLSTPPGTFVDWMVGIAATIWLIVIVTVPWNLHFEAKAVLQDAHRSKERDIQVDHQELAYAQKVAKNSLWIALGLHLISAVALYALAHFEVSVVGYFGAGATLLLTLLRPAIRAYEFISARLATLKQEVSFPREDVLSLQYKVQEIESNLQYLQQAHADQTNIQEQNFQAHTQQLSVLKKDLSDLTNANEEAHSRLAEETRHAVAQLTEDGKFINNIVEIIRFVKKV
ncbi:MAG TPA: hypothetical protein DCS93_36005 [Microscillaceae bacterium]|nr:hypothetical protein [Microscillaceae bacterium]